MQKTEVSNFTGEAMFAISRRRGKNGKRKTNAVRKPTLYTKPIVSKILNRLIEGESLIRICRDTNMPTMPTIYNWINRYPDFREQYRVAKMLQMDTLADRLLDITDDESNLQRARLMSDNIKWLASKLKPKKYGNKLALAGNSAEPVKISVEYVKSHNMNTEN